MRQRAVCSKSVARLGEDKKEQNSINENRNKSTASTRLELALKIMMSITSWLEGDHKNIEVWATNMQA